MVILKTSKNGAFQGIYLSVAMKDTCAIVGKKAYSAGKAVQL